MSPYPWRSDAYPFDGFSVLLWKIKIVFFIKFNVDKRGGGYKGLNVRLCA